MIRRMNRGCRKTAFPPIVPPQQQEVESYDYFEQLEKLRAEQKSAAEQIKSDVVESMKIPVEWKQDSNSNELIGYASVFGGPPDEQGDIISEGAFRKTIRERVKPGLVMLLDSHQYNAESTLGKITEAQETDYGLLIKAKLSSAPSAMEIKQKMTSGMIDKLSIGYDAVKQRYGKLNGRTVRYLDEVKLYEVSVVPIPALDRAQILSVKGQKKGFRFFDGLQTERPSIYD